MRMLTALLYFLSGAAFVVGIHHLFIFLRARARWQALCIALLCFQASAYEIACAGLYSASSPAAGLKWQTLQLALLSLQIPVLLGLIYQVVAKKFGAWEWALTAWGVLSSILVLLGNTGLALRMDAPLVKQVSLGSRVLITYHEFQWSVVSMVWGTISIGLILYNLWLLFPHMHRSRQAMSVFWVLCIYLGSVVNDSLVAWGWLPFVYVGEYGILVFVLVAAYGFARDAAQYPAARENASRLEAIIAAAPLGFHLYQRRPDGRVGFLKANAYADKILGDSCASMAGLESTRAASLLAEAEIHALFDPSPTAPACIEKERVFRKAGEIFCTLDILAVRVDAQHAVAFIRDISDRKMLEREIVSYSEAELRKIGIELHDTIGQQMGGLSFLAAGLKERLAVEKHSEVAVAETLCDSLMTVMADIRRIMTGLSPEFSMRNLTTALKALAQRTTQTLGLLCTAQFSGGDPELDEPTMLNLYRIVQESITNAVKHARAQHVHIEMQNHAVLCLSVQDDGVGLDLASAPGKGNGLKIMQYRANLIGATLEITGGSGEGTRVECRLSPDTARNRGPGGEGGHDGSDN
ncbi:MAG: hypothetical protein KA248_03235 [Kiritimatiellae bacterium]|nr:hypothetical protein [Kiritimatiellia bacterium]